MSEENHENNNDGEEFDHDTIFRASYPDKHSDKEGLTKSNQDQPKEEKSSKEKSK